MTNPAFTNGESNSPPPPTREDILKYFEYSWQALVCVIFVCFRTLNPAILKRHLTVVFIVLISGDMRLLGAVFLFAGVLSAEA